MCHALFIFYLWKEWDGEEKLPLTVVTSAILLKFNNIWHIFDKGKTYAILNVKGKHLRAVKQNTRNSSKHSSIESHVCGGKNIPKMISFPWIIVLLLLLFK